MVGERFLNLHKIQKYNIDIHVNFLLDIVEGAYSPGSRIIPKFRKQIIIGDYNNTDHTSIIVMI
jgi:hypothetical protein